MQNKRILFLLLFFGIYATIAEGAIRLPSVLSDHMVLQRNSTVRLWGWSNASEHIEITPSWDGHTYKTQATRDARWVITIPTPEAGGPYTITFKASNELILEDILIGEVWICSGQSNMEWSANSGFENSDQILSEANNSNIRLFHIPRTTSEHPQDDCHATWQVSNVNAVRGFSAVGYVFGQKLHTELNVPVGIIEAAWGGTAAEVWTPADVIANDPEFSQWDAVLSTTDWWPRTPAYAFNGMIHPVKNFRIAGAIWYQGEANTANPLVYRDLFPAMINSWRTAFDYPMPFYYVQIAPFDYGDNLNGALVREAQMMTMSKVPNTGMVVVDDIGNVYDIHPRNKIDVGQRLANWAMARTYGIQDVIYSGPIYSSHEVENGAIRISFSYAEDGLLSKDGPLTGFEIAGEDQIFFPAKATIEGSEVLVSSDLVLQPVAVRYSFTNTGTHNLFNQHGLPASAFRTDDWPINVNMVDIEIAYKPEAEAYLVTLSAEEGAEIKYSSNGRHPGLFGLTYTRPFYIESECTLKALAIKDGKPSDLITTKEVKLNKATFMPITYDGTYHDSRTGGGHQALIDGIVGSNNAADGTWQGYLGKDMSVTLDFGQRVEVSSINIHALKNQNQRIFLPNKVVFEISNDGERFNEVYRKPLFHGKDAEVSIMDYEFEFRNPRKTRYVRISAENMGRCPSWHDEADQPAWMMFDEITIE